MQKRHWTWIAVFGVLALGATALYAGSRQDSSNEQAGDRESDEERARGDSWDEEPRAVGRLDASAARELEHAEARVEQPESELASSVSPSVQEPVVPRDPRVPRLLPNGMIEPALQPDPGRPPPPDLTNRHGSPPPGARLEQARAAQRMLDEQIALNERRLQEARASGNTAMVERLQMYLRRMREQRPGVLQRVQEARREAGE